VCAQRSGQHCYCFRVADASQRMSAPPCQVHLVKRHIWACVVRRAVRRQDLHGPFERSEAVRALSGGGQCFAVRCSEPCAEQRAPRSADVARVLAHGRAVGGPSDVGQYDGLLGKRVGV
jgi:hypothetical protein